MHKKVKKIVFLVLGAALLTGIFFYLTKPLEVQTVEIEKKTLVRDFKETGKLESVEKISVTPAFDGKVLHIVALGDFVKEGDPLIQLDSGDLIRQKEELSANRQSLVGQEKMNTPVLYQSQTESADIAIRMAQDEVERAGKDLERYEVLFKEGALPEMDYEKFKRIYETALKQLELKKNQKEQLMEQSGAKDGSKEFYDSQKKAISVRMGNLDEKISKQVVYAQISGIVTAMSAQEGDFVSQHQSVMEISSVDRMKIVCDVLSSDAAMLEKGQQVKLLRKVGDDTVEGKGTITEIASYAKTQISSLGLEEQRVEVKIEPTNLEDLVLGTDLDIIFETMRIEDVFAVSKSSVFEEDGHYLWTVRDGKLQKQAVEIGRESDYDYEILSGLQEGDILVTNPDNVELKEGRKVRVIQR